MILCAIIILEILRFIVVLIGGCEYIELFNAFLDHGITAVICFSILILYKKFDQQDNE